MATWSVKTAEKKSIEEHEIWTKGKMTIRRITGFRWGEYHVTTEDENPPEFELAAVPGGDDNEDSVNMNECGYESEMIELDDSWYEDIVWPDNMAPFARDTMEVKWDEDPYSGWEENGWLLDETEVWFTGPLEINRVED